ncbi:hypothetical protein B0H16DRAFT_1715277 [Mycena metata]|uniref:Uncharacterized protein n=1 Tax=Mycena metata TaxID=1033252 RepID=A0AAD7NQB2_9AGAR|nr:hypothetical protein B0H16DRAFT_1715277 [Mycena metata]
MAVSELPEWQAQQQQMAAAAASYNPYKRVPRPPSAEYLATKLSDNPLGLTNMVPREELFGPTTDEGIAAATPWIWNPRGLDPDDNEQGTSTNSRRAEPPPPASAPPYGNRAVNAPPPPIAGSAETACLRVTLRNHRQTGEHLLIPFRPWIDP